MAFNFNWSPLTADAEFYTRAQDMLTAALNKSPKPPIIVDDIIVNEFNLGHVPPELEILEIGDLAEDRFRGIFKMCYSGDAFLTLKTRVQANPLNTYLFSKPSFTSPQPLAASTGLTIPLQITLSDIKLSAFIIVVFSKQKGLTLVFRNDPLESLKVSSTFDSIPFVREYLQKVIEMQLRTLMMDELPAIIHRLSLRLWCPESGAAREEEDRSGAAAKLKEAEVTVDPFASPPQDAVDAHGHVLDAEEISSLSLEGGSETHSLFSQKNLLRLAALTDSQRTLSLFTPSIRDAVFRAWAGPERGENNGLSSSMTPSLSRTNSTFGGVGTTYTFSDNGSDGASTSARPQLTSLPSTTGLSLGAGRHARSHGKKKKKNRVVNLRKKKAPDDSASESGESMTATESSYLSNTDSLDVPGRVPEEPEEELITPPRSPQARVRFMSRHDSIDLGESPRTLRPHLARQGGLARTFTGEVPQQAVNSPASMETTSRLSGPQLSRVPQPSLEVNAGASHSTFPAEKCPGAPTSDASVPYHYTPAAAYAAPQTSGAGIIEQAWMLKMANEMSRRVHDEKSRGFWDGASRSDRDDTPPPAYEVQ
ncbi:MAG: ERMES complex subunit [Claussenomyces sp. TS43310]|nr:MAG: ERMES complex subunit [Claussenomyces sp. TS43310]